MLQTMLNRVIALFTAGSMITFGLLGAANSVVLWLEWADLTTEGELLDATIIAKEDNFPLGANYRIIYEVAVDEETVTWEERVLRPLYRQLEVGQIISVRSLPEHTLPLAIEGNTGRLIEFTATAGLWILVGLLLGLFLMNYLNRVTRLRQELPQLDMSTLMAAMAASAEESEDAADEEPASPNSDPGAAQN